MFVFVNVYVHGYVYVLVQVHELVTESVFDIIAIPKPFRLPG